MLGNFCRPYPLVNRIATGNWWPKARQVSEGPDGQGDASSFGDVGTRHIARALLIHLADRLSIHAIAADGAELPERAHRRRPRRPQRGQRATRRDPRPSWPRPGSGAGTPPATNAAIIAAIGLRAASGRPSGPAPRSRPASPTADPLPARRPAARRADHRPGGRSTHGSSSPSTLTLNSPLERMNRPVLARPFALKGLARGGKASRGGLISYRLSKGCGFDSHLLRFWPHARVVPSGYQVRGAFSVSGLPI